MWKCHLIILLSAPIFDMCWFRVLEEEEEEEELLSGLIEQLSQLSPISAVAFCGSTLRTCHVEDAAQHFHAGPHLEQMHAAKRVPAVTGWESTSGRVTCHPHTHQVASEERGYRADMAAGIKLVTFYHPFIFLVGVDAISSTLVCFKWSNYRKPENRRSVQVFPSDSLHFQSLLSALWRKQKVTFPYIQRHLWEKASI